MGWGEKLSRWMQGRRGPHGLARWHKWHAAAPVKLIDGTFSRASGGQLWRRKAADGWEYEQDDHLDERDPEDTRQIDWE